MPDNINIEITEELVGYLSAFGEMDVNSPDLATLERFVYEAIQIGALIHQENSEVLNSDLRAIVVPPHAKFLRRLRMNNGPIADDPLSIDPLMRRRPHSRPAVKTGHTRRGKPPLRWPELPE